MRITTTAKIAATAPAAGLAAMTMTGAVASASPAPGPPGGQPAATAATPATQSEQTIKLPTGKTAHRYTGTVNSGQVTVKINYASDGEFIQHTPGEIQDITDSPWFENHSDSRITVSKPAGYPDADGIPQPNIHFSVLANTTKVTVSHPIWNNDPMTYDFTMYSGSAEGAWAIFVPF